MPYQAITDKSSYQYRLQQIAYTDEYGIREVDSRYIIAIGTAFNANIGTYVDLELKNGEIIQCIVGDIKADLDTLEDNITTSDNGCVSEFICDVDNLVPNVKLMGDISCCNTNWNSPVIKIEIYNKNIFKED